MELRDYLRILRKNWILIVACTLLGVASAAAFSIMATPKYDATTKLYVSVKSNDSSVTGELVQGGTFARQAVISYVDVVSSPRVLDPVINDLGLETTAADLAESIAASSPLNTVLIEITVSDSDPQLAANIANSVGQTFSTVVVEELEKPEGNEPSPVKIETIQPAVAPLSPSSPRVPLNIALGLLLGLAVGFGAAVLRSVLDTRIHTSHDIELVTDKPILGGISYDPDTTKRPLVVHINPMHPRAEAFRTLRTNLQFVNLENQRNSFVVTSAVPGDGKTTTVANLAIALSETGVRVALIDGDLRKPKIAEIMGLEGSVGLTDVLIGRVELADVLQRWGNKQLYVLPSGRIPPNPSELLGSKAMSSLLDTLSTDVDYVLIDAPPLLLVTDAAVLSKLAGGALLVAASGKTRRNELAAAVRALEHVGSQVSGVVVNRLPTKGPDAYGYGQYGYAQYGHTTQLQEDALKTAQASAKRRA